MTTEQPEKMRSTWSRALEVIKNSRFLGGGSVSKRESSLEDESLLNDDQLNERAQNQQGDFQVVDLSYPPREKVLSKLTDLVAEMQEEGNGLKTFLHIYHVNEQNEIIEKNALAEENEDEEELDEAVEEDNQEEEEEEEAEEEEAEEEQDEVENDEEENPEEDDGDDADDEEENTEDAEENCEVSESEEEEEGGEGEDDDELENEVSDDGEEEEEENDVEANDENEENAEEDDDEEPEDVDAPEDDEEYTNNYNELLDKEEDEEEEEEDESEEEENHDESDEEENDNENDAEENEEDIEDDEGNEEEEEEEGCESFSFDDEDTVQVPRVFKSADVIEWLTKHLDIDSDKEAAHLASMLCKMGFIFPCNMAWDLRTIKLSKEDSMILKFQTQQYWPTEGHIASETEHARHLLVRQSCNFGVPFDDYETDYLATLESLLSHKWELLKNTADMQKRAMAECISLSEQYLTSWQDYAYWRLYRPSTFVECSKSTNPYEWAVCLRGLSRNLPSFGGVEIQVKKPAKEELSEEEIDQALKKSCKRIISHCEKTARIDPFIIENYSTRNPWTNECVVISNEVPNKIRCDSWELGLDYLLGDKIGKELFGQHLKQEFSFENLDFYLRSVQLRYAPQRQVEELAQSIFDEFISEESSTQINISEETCSLVSNEMKCERLRYAFDQALLDIYYLMKKDSYIRFLSSPLCKEAVERALTQS